MEVTVELPSPPLNPMEDLVDLIAVVRELGDARMCPVLIRHVVSGMCALRVHSQLARGMEPDNPYTHARASWLHSQLMRSAEAHGVIQPGG